jgi:hypothetical protein
MTFLSLIAESSLPPLGSPVTLPVRVNFAS